MLMRLMLLIPCHKLFFNWNQSRPCENCEFDKNIFAFSKHEFYLKTTNFFLKLLPTVT